MKEETNVSEHLVRLIPRLHTYRTNEASARAAVLALQKCVKAEEISITFILYR